MLFCDDQGGFTLPEGLRRHLVGWGNVSQCGVTEAASELARECWDHQWRQAELEDERQKQELLAQRRRTEMLYRSRPDWEPELRDRTYEPRSEASWPIAEERLRQLAFVESVEANVKSYVREHDDCVVYADPRSSNRIDFVVCPKPLPKRFTSRSRPRFRFFHLLDTWTKDLEGKYQARLQPRDHRP